MKIASALLVALALLGLHEATAQPPSSSPSPIIHQDALIKVSQHVYVIPDEDVPLVPNVGIVVGERATLVIDTGLGERNGAIVLGEARKVSAAERLYVAATHFHPEHDLGAGAFPDDAVLVRWSGQQAEADETGVETIRRFSGFSPVVAELLDGATYRAPDVLFHDELKLDLGGVRVRIWGAGPNHTRGDTVFFVEEDRVLFTGDVVMSVFPSVSAQYASYDKWLANLDAFEALEPAVIVPAHGRMGDTSLIRRYREYLTAVRERVREAKRTGASVEEAQRRLAADIEAEFADLTTPRGSAGRIAAAIQAAYRE
ncbi:MAG TPA: MBL fold metallo-hydrolase [Gammaproteobacteria bacterium]